MKQFSGSRVANKLRLILSIVSVTLIISNCSGGDSSGGSATLNTGSALTVDNAGVVPILGDSPTTTVIYVHNNSNIEIKGIKYAIHNNTTPQQSNLPRKNAKIISLDSKSSIDKVNADGCETIPAKHSCPLQFTTPSISAQDAQGSMLITANYATQSGANSEFSQVVNYMKVNSVPRQGLLFNSGVQISGFNNRDGYATLYLFGTNNKQYKINSITSSDPVVKIVQDDLTGKLIPVNHVQAIEVIAPIFKKVSTTQLNVNSQDNFEKYTNNATLSVVPSADGAILTSGVVPLVDTSVSSPRGN